MSFNTSLDIQFEAYDREFCPALAIVHIIRIGASEELVKHVGSEFEYFLKKDIRTSLTLLAMNDHEHHDDGVDKEQNDSVKDKFRCKDRPDEKMTPLNGHKDRREYGI